jgi:hypothetical protein
MQSVPIITGVVSSNLDDGEVYTIISVTCYRSVFSHGPPVLSINKTHRHDITEILLKVVLSTTKQTIF